MNQYEELMSVACEEGLIVKEKPLQYNNGRIKGNRIAIRQDLDNTTQKACVLSEELGHHYTTTGDILDQSSVENRKQELHARIWAYDKMIGLSGLIRAYEHGCRSRSEAAEYLQVTEEFLIDAVECYKSKYGTCIKVDNYLLIFEPNLMIGKSIDN